MSGQASIYGRLGQPPKSIQTKSGKPMASASIAIGVGERDEAATEWFWVVAFRRTADELRRHDKSDLVSAMGNLSLNVWTVNDGEERRTWQIIANAVLSACTTQPKGGGRKQDATLTLETGRADSSDFNDPRHF